MIRTALAIALSLAAAASAAAGEALSSTVPSLTVRGDAELHKPADQLRIRIAVVTEATLAAAALDDNTKRMRAVVEALEKAGLAADDYETGHFSLRPKYSRRPRGGDPEWQPQIVGYEVTNSLSVKTKKLGLAGTLIEAANRAGANAIDSINFDLADPRIHRGEAITTAATNARSDAAVLARAADVRLVRVISVTLDQASWQPPPPMMMARAEGLAAEAAAPPIQPGDVTVVAGVTIVYEIAPLQ